MSSPEPLAAERIVLVGFMGAGKTTVGTHLARRLGWGLFDMDQRIEARMGMDVSRFFAEKGEPAFRKEEYKVALEAANLKHYVIAAGGGAFVQEGTREVLQRGAVVTVWLRCDLDVALGRIQGDGSRPLAGNRAIMQDLLALREPLYRQADMAVDSAQGSPAEVAGRVVEVVRGRRPAADLR